MFETPQPATALHRFAETHYLAMQHAAFLLGGAAALRKAQILLDDLYRGGAVARQMLRDVDMLQALFAQRAALEAEGPWSAPRPVPDLGEMHTADIALLVEALDDAIVGTRCEGIEAQNAGGRKGGHD